MLTLRSAFRSLRATPLVSAVAILSLALGIGANTAIFSITDALILRSLPVEHADRLAVLRYPSGHASWTNPIWESIRSRPELFDGAFGAGDVSFNASTSGEVDEIQGLYTSGQYFEVLGVRPVMGRFFTVEDDRRGGGPDGPVAVISEALWRSRFGAAGDILGRNFALSGVNYTIIGVAPRSFFGHDVGRKADVWVPLGTEPLVRGERSFLDHRSAWWMNVFVRLKPGQTAEQATALFRSVQPQIKQETTPPNYRPQDAAQYLTDPLSITPGSGGVSGLRNQYRKPLLALTAVVAFTLLIACGNIANLLLARATARRSEFALKTALGASRWRVAKQLIAENLLLSGIGAALGTVVALVGSRIIVSQIATPAEGIYLDIGIDWRMLGFTALIALVVTMVFGIAPTLLATNVAPMEAMKEQGRGSGSRKNSRFAGALIVAQVSLSLLLLVGAGLFVRTFMSLADLELGFDPERTLIARVNTSTGGLDASQRRALWDRTLAAVQNVPGVTAAGLSVVTPVSGSSWNDGFVFPELPDLPEMERIVNVNYVTPGWFDMMRTPITAGRDFDARDRSGGVVTAVVNQKFVEKYYANTNPIGKVFRTEDRPNAPTYAIEIIGVVANTVYSDLREGLSPTIYGALAQQGEMPGGISLTVRTVVDEPMALTDALTRAITTVDPRLSVSYRLLEGDVEGAMTQERLLAMLSAFFGGLALLLAALGLYGITAYAVIRRRGEIGIRLALGSTPTQVVRMVLSRTGALVGAGIVIGGAAAWYLSRFISTLLFGLTPTDVPTIVGAMALLTLVSAIAGWVPARRAAGIDPAETLREG